MQNPNSVPGYLPRDNSFRYVDRKPAAEVPDLEAKHDRRLDYLQEQINKLSSIVENKFELSRKSATRHNLLVNSGFIKVTAGVPESWTSAGVGVTFSQVANRPGGNTANFSTRIASGANAGTLKQTVPVFPGQKFSLAGWAKVVSGTGLISLVSNGTNPVTQQIKLSVRGGAAGGFESFPSLMYTAPMMEIPADGTTVTLTLQSNANSTIDFCEMQYGHGTQRVPHLWVNNPQDILPLGGVATGAAVTATILSASASTLSSFVSTSHGYTAPVAANFTALNSATITDVTTDLGPGVNVHGVAAGGTATANTKGAEQSMAYVSGTKTLVAGITFLQYGENYNFSGVYFRESGTGKIIMFDITDQNADHKINISKWSSATSGGVGDYFDHRIGQTSKVFMKLTYDGTNMRFYISYDFASWIQVHTAIAKADYFTTAPDTWGFFSNQQNGQSLDGDTTCFHWLVS